MIKELVFTQPGLALGEAYSDDMIHQVIQKFDKNANVLKPGSRRNVTLHNKGKTSHFDVFVTPDGEGIIIETPEEYIHAMVGQEGGSLLTDAPDTRRFKLSNGPVVVTNTNGRRLERIVYQTQKS